MACRLLVPGFDVNLAHYLAVAQIERLGAQNTRSVRVLARLEERDATVPNNLVLDAVGHLPAEYVTQVLGDIFLPAQHLRRTRSGVLVDCVYLGVVGVEADECLGVALLDGPAQGLKVHTTGCLRRHDVLLSAASIS